MKKCIHCNETKPLSDFYKDKYAKTGHASRCKPCSYNKHREWVAARKYGVTTDEIQELWERQEGKCAVCADEIPAGLRGFSIDHNHETGSVRGLLCANCNAGIGLLKDSPTVLQSAIQYLNNKGYYGPTTP